MPKGTGSTTATGTPPSAPAASASGSTGVATAPTTSNSAVASSAKLRSAKYKILDAELSLQKPTTEDLQQYRNELANIMSNASKEWFNPAYPDNRDKSIVMLRLGLSQQKSLKKWRNESLEKMIISKIDGLKDLCKQNHDTKVILENYQITNQKIKIIVENIEHLTEISLQYLIDSCQTLHQHYLKFLPETNSTLSEALDQAKSELKSKKQFATKHLASLLHEIAMQICFNDSSEPIDFEEKASAIFDTISPTLASSHDEVLIIIYKNLIKNKYDQNEKIWGEIIKLWQKTIKELSDGDYNLTSDSDEYSYKIYIYEIIVRYNLLQKNDMVIIELLSNELVALNKITNIDLVPFYHQLAEFCIKVGGFFCDTKTDNPDSAGKCFDLTAQIITLIPVEQRTKAEKEALEKQATANKIYFSALTKEFAPLFAATVAPSASSSASAAGNTAPTTSASGSGSGGGAAVHGTNSTTGKKHPAENREVEGVTPSPTKRFRSTPTPKFTLAALSEAARYALREKANTPDTASAATANATSSTAPAANRL